MSFGLFAVLSFDNAGVPVYRLTQRAGEVGQASNV